MAIVSLPINNHFIWIKLFDQKYILVGWIKNRIQLHAIFRSKHTHRLKIFLGKQHAKQVVTKKEPG